MANVYLGLKELFRVEFSNDANRFLHKNDNENGYTLGGVYQVANPSGIDWELISNMVDLVGIKRASRMLFYDVETMEAVKNIYSEKYWHKLNLDKVHSQSIANEIFLFAVVAGVTSGAKMAQRLVGVTDDGIIGANTLRALNGYDERDFDREFDNLEIAYFEDLAEDNESLNKYLNGWKNRARYV